MDYAEAAAAFFVLRQEGTALPVAVAEGSPAPPADSRGTCPLSLSCTIFTHQFDDLTFSVVDLGLAVD